MINKKFLKQLQHEMLTQDKCSQAAPRYWGILETDKQYGMSEDYADDYELVDEDGNDLETPGDLRHYLEKNLDDIVSELDAASAQIVMDGNLVKILIRYNEEDEEGEEDEEITIDGPEEAVDFLDRVNLGYEKKWYAFRHRVVPGPIFLTKRAAQEYCDKYGYNHNDPHPYAMTEYRSPEIEMLWSILEKTDWDDIICGSDYLAVKLWSAEDIRARLAELDYEQSDDNVAAVTKSGIWKQLEACDDSDWNIIDDAVEKAMQEKREPRLYISPEDETVMQLCGPHVRVDWINDGEGVCGDYKPDDPDDVNLLRFEVFYRENADIPDDWFAVDDASYCTRMPADAPEEILLRALKVLYKEYVNVLESDPEQSVKKLGERLSWICPEDFEEATK